MLNDNTKLIKLVGLNQYDIDNTKATIYVDISLQTTILFICILVIN